MAALNRALCPLMGWTDRASKRSPLGRVAHIERSMSYDQDMPRHHSGKPALRSPLADYVGPTLSPQACVEPVRRPLRGLSPKIHGINVRW